MDDAEYARIGREIVQLAESEEGYWDAWQVHEIIAGRYRFEERE